MRDFIEGDLDVIAGKLPEEPVERCALGGTERGQLNARFHDAAHAVELVGFVVVEDEAKPAKQGCRVLIRVSHVRLLW
jgi:hypothetical protein